MIGEELQEIVDEADMKMDDAVQYLKKEFSHIRAGKANPALIQGIQVEYYGAQTPLQQLANISAPEARLLLVQPYDKSIITDIEKGIMSSGLGLNPMNDGDMIRIPLPILTEERRKELVKIASNYGFKTIWVNRFNSRLEKLPGEPDKVITSLKQIEKILKN